MADESGPSLTDMFGHYWQPDLTASLTHDWWRFLENNYAIQAHG
jgi:hypothetical protein